MGGPLTLEQILADTFSSHPEPVWVLEVRPDRDRRIGCSPAAEELLASLGLSSDNLEVVLGSIGVPRSLIMGGLWSLGSFSTSTAYGIVHATKISSESRPALMVVCLHDKVSEAHAWSEHPRLVISPRVNEEATGAIQMARTAVAEMESVVGKLQDMLHDFNHQMDAVHRAPQQGRRETPPSPLTWPEHSRQG